MYKKILKLILIILWCTVIFSFSSENGNDSNSRSKKIISNVVVVINSNIKEEKKNKIVEKTNYIVRKSAHFTEYFILSLLIYLFIIEFNLNKIKYLVPIIFCFIYASSDEIHQMFTYNRTPIVIIIDILKYISI